MENLDQYLSKYAGLLSRKCHESLRPLHSPTNPAHPRLAELLRRPFEAQAHVATAVAALLKEQKAALLIAEMGTGKTLLSQAAIHCHADGRPYRALVFCPGQLTKKWAREIGQTLPGVGVHQIHSIEDLVPLVGQGKPANSGWWIVARDRAKLGPGWQPAVTYRCLRYQDGTGRWVNARVPSCPRCGHAIDDKDGLLIPVEKLECRQQSCLHCKEPLWSWVPRPRRWAPATFIHKKLHGFFDYLVIDEAHEEKSATSAQANAIGALASACKKVIACTGTLLGGYAHHVRPLLFRLAPQTLVAEGLGWSDAKKFMERYGRQDTIITERESEGRSNRQSRGSSKSVRTADRPGVMPSLFGNHLLDKAVFLRLDEVAAGLPALTEDVQTVELTGAAAGEYEAMSAALRDRVKEMMSSSHGRDQRLLGTMLSSLLNWPDTCWADWGPLGYKEGEAFVQVCRPAMQPAGSLYPKEEALLKLCQAEQAVGRQVWVYVQMTERFGLLDRLQQVLTGAGLRVGVLKASVDLAKREEWIAKNGQNVDVMLSHPKLVETGLDLFSKDGHNFCTLVFYQTGYQLFTLRQASRRSWRIGQTKDCRVVYLHYAGTMQAQALALMGRKLAAAETIDGKFSAEGLAACGDDGNLELALARALVDKVQDDPARLWARVGEARPPAPQILHMPPVLSERAKLRLRLVELMKRRGMVV